uniref:Amino acid transporter transmembrane domain-containing protein n=1 Tax=Physcomitrium patens TaxID=3218 RepID=A0A7I4DX28_PHYPA
MGVGNDLSKDNGNSVKPYESIPRLPLGNVHHRPLSSSCKTFFNIVIMVVGAGVLGLPHAFMQSGWLQGLLILEGTSATMYYCMMLLVSCRRHLEREGIVDSVNTYSELGRHILGMAGQVSVDAMIVVSQGRSSQFLRTFIVLCTAWIAVSVPHFGNFLSLVGSSVCCVLSFVLPGWMHLRVFGDSLSVMPRSLDWFLIISGIVFGIFDTLSSLHDIGW